MRTELTEFLGSPSMKGETQESKPGRASDTSVVLIDDHPTALLELFDRIAEAGYRVSASTRVQAGLEYMAEHPTDVAVVSFEIKEMDGIELLERIRRISPAPAVVVLSGCVDWDLGEEIGRHGGARLLSRRATGAAILGAIRDLTRAGDRPRLVPGGVGARSEA